MECLMIDRVFKLPPEFNDKTRVAVIPGSEGEYDLLVLSHPLWAPSVLNMNTGEVIELTANFDDE